ncbi:unnamed protein product [Tetraodon nigroviridis]|uniref:(spotted green pufferfish) hypothetical protein n=1 Tax=Tetraodon nigroviridis TaxID=99883 RepID=Q4RNB1_TETNG|nr:unnamed protein product [Tetraodon nigroviridis]
MSELTEDLERMTEHTEKMSLQLTWMAHDLVVLRASPELASSMRKLEDAYRGCRAAVCGLPEPDKSPAAPGAQPD